MGWIPHRRPPPSRAALPLLRYLRNCTRLHGSQAHPLHSRVAPPVRTPPPFPSQPPPRSPTTHAHPTHPSPPCSSPPHSAPHPTFLLPQLMHSRSHPPSKPSLRYTTSLCSLNQLLPPPASPKSHGNAAKGALTAMPPCRSLHGHRARDQTAPLPPPPLHWLTLLTQPHLAKCRLSVHYPPPPSQPPSPPPANPRSVVCCEKGSDCHATLQESREPQDACSISPPTHPEIPAPVVEHSAQSPHAGRGVQARALPSSLRDPPGLLSGPVHGRPGEAWFLQPPSCRPGPPRTLASPVRGPSTWAGEPQLPTPPPRKGVSRQRQRGRLQDALGEASGARAASRWFDQRGGGTTPVSIHPGGATEGGGGAGWQPAGAFQVSGADFTGVAGEEQVGGFRAKPL